MYVCIYIYIYIYKHICVLGARGAQGPCRHRGFTLIVVRSRFDRLARGWHDVQNRCVRGHANLRIVPMLTDDPRRESGLMTRLIVAAQGIPLACRKEICALPLVARHEPKLVSLTARHPYTSESATLRCWSIARTRGQRTSQAYRPRGQEVNLMRVPNHYCMLGNVAPNT